MVINNLINLIDVDLIFLQENVISIDNFFITNLPSSLLEVMVALYQFMENY